MARSKTPTKKSKAGAKRTASMLDDENVTALTSFAVLVGYVYLIGSGFGVDNWVSAFGRSAIAREDISIFGNGFSALLVMHVLNHAQDAGTGFWIGSFVNVFTSAFAGSLLMDVVSGTPPLTQCNEKNLSITFLCWYLTNHNIPFTQMNLWSALNDIAGDIIQCVLRACSAAYTFNLIVGAVETAKANNTSGLVTDFAVFTPVVYAIFAGAASQFFPLNKGVNVDECTDAINYAIIVAVILMTDGFSAVPVVSNIVATLIEVFGGLENTLLIATILNDVFGYLIPANMAPWTYTQDFLYGVTGLSRS